MLRYLFSYAPAQILSAASVFFLIALQTNYLAIVDYGYLAVYMLIIELVRACSSQWINVTLLRLYPSSNAEDRHAYIRASLRMIWLLFIPAAGFIATALLLYRGVSLSIFFSLSFLLASKTIYLYLLDLTRLNGNVKYYAIASMTQSVAVLGITWGLLVFNPLVELAIIAIGIASLLGVIILLPIHKIIKVQVESEKIQLILSYGLPLMLSGLLSVSASRIDRFFIADQLGMVKTGLYSALSNTVLGVVSLVFMVVAMPLYPELTKLVNNPTQLKLKHAQYFDMLMFISLPSIIGLCFIATPLISLFLGAEYIEQGVEVFWCLALAFFLLNIRSHYFDHGLQFRLKTGYMPLITGGGVIVNIFMLLFLINPMGVLGASWALVIANLFTIFSSYFLSNLFGYRFKVGPSLWKVIVSALIMTLCLYGGLFLVAGMSMISQLVTQILIGLTSYFILNFILNTFNIRSHIHRLA